MSGAVVMVNMQQIAKDLTANITSPRAGLDEILKRGPINQNSKALPVRFAHLGVVLLLGAILSRPF